MYKREKNSWLKHMDFMLLDIVSLFVAIFFAYLIYFHSFNLFKYKTYRNITILMLFIDLITMIMFNTMHNVLKRGLFQEFAKTLKHVFVVYGFLTITLFAYKFTSIYSRVTISLSALLFLLISYLIRLIWKKYVLRRILSSNKTNMILICSSADVKRFVERSSDINLGDVSGVVLTDRNGEGEMIYDLPVVANLDNAGEYICREWVDDIYVVSGLMKCSSSRRPWASLKLRMSLLIKFQGFLISADRWLFPSISVYLLEDWERKAS